VTIELYDLERDPGEQHNVASEFPGIVEELLTLMENSRRESEIFRLKSMPADR